MWGGQVAFLRGCSTGEPPASCFSAPACAGCVCVFYWMWKIVQVSDVFKRPNLESPAKSVFPEVSHMFENRFVQMLGHIKNGSRHPRAVLFKVLADTVSLESKLVVGVPNDGGVGCVDSYKHMSVLVTSNSMELMVDLMRFPGQLIPCSTKAIFMTHISAAGESDSAENDSCDSPLEPNRPLFGYSERVDPESQKKKLSWRWRLKMLCDICRGLMCIHQMKIIHRDLKSANCLVNKHWTVKICDFGLSRVVTEPPMQESSCAGTPEWIAPELIRNEPVNEKCDIFSLGVIMWELCTLNRPWDGVPPERVVYAVANESTRLQIPDPEGPFRRLITDCWTEPQDCPSCEEILYCLLECEYTLLC